MNLKIIVASLALVSGSSFAVNNADNEALSKLITTANSNNATAQALASYSFFSGANSELDQAQALSYLKNAHKAGVGAATWLLGQLHKQGDVLSKDSEKAQYLIGLANKRNFSNDQGVLLLDKETFTQYIHSVNFTNNKNNSSNENLFSSMRNNSNWQSNRSSIDRAGGRNGL
ncbi:hypothetical protein [Pseudoalteromonas sp. G4]|uniref:hypothetical protein n=1 Tax=Pseudoalteromonas sp. G4 TaxID=2992761 RepID=UPI00237E38F9|nr:hypothetical protein [Pseudoalteromonas sp. G4]MDE3271038.1 hypothetical protein [Pseudoalteromonas sp. G4]